jgi:phosphoribosylanthranilate isomerase
LESRVPTLALTKIFEPVSDYFLTDTLLLHNPAGQPIQQPENGFVGITGKVCDWNMAEKMVMQSKIPVILAGGISPENVFDGILKVKPAGVDSCTHTNLLDERGKPVRFRKDPEKITKLMAETRRAELEINEKTMEGLK